MVNLLMVFSILTVSLHAGDAIRCYVCSSAREPGCKDPFNKDHHYHRLTECTQDSMRNIGDVLPGIYSNFHYQSAQPEDFVCVKAVTREHDKEDVVRSCSIPRTDTFDVCSQLKSRNLAFCQACNGDSCNGAEATAAKSLLLAFLPVLGLGLFGCRY